MSCRAVLLLGLLFATVAVHYTWILLRLLLGKNAEKDDLEAMASVVSAFCIYTAFLAFNGMTEAFCTGVVVALDMKMVSQMGLVHGLMSLLFALVVAPIFIRIMDNGSGESVGAVIGLIYANAFCMALRGWIAIWFAARYFPKQENRSGDVSITTKMLELLHDMSPHGMVWLAFGVSYQVTKYSLQQFQSNSIGNKWWYKDAVVHVGVGISCVLGIATISILFERSFWKRLYDMFRESKTTTKRQKQE
eukprot:CAMPEP_0116826910 /NCGR_PEP_ID=MMETSP0418-20121206/2797_1 /TAXON_ID=1158023 /ORGANISM="Astrosyne radiata, Strain 13vi08-1A" /LENGTH=247 /DNA_ID=CAMNT_0004455609 /DNA_START=58 /DNA_END=801 /DNA_ORIENTATION=+